MKLSISMISAMSLKPAPVRTTLFPCTTLFRSEAASAGLLGAQRSTAMVLAVFPRLSGVLGNLQGEGDKHMSLRSSALLIDRKSTRLNSSHGYISYAVFCLKNKIA